MQWKCRDVVGLTISPTDAKRHETTSKAVARGRPFLTAISEKKPAAQLVSHCQPPNRSAAIDLCSNGFLGVRHIQPCLPSRECEFINKNVNQAAHHTAGMFVGRCVTAHNPAGCVPD